VERTSPFATITMWTSPADRTRDDHHREQGNIMNRNGWLAVVGVATFVAVSAASAQDGYARLSFTGSVVQEACHAGAPLGVQGSERSCGSGSSRAIYTENTATAQHATGVAMLDYFADRPDGGRKVVVTRQYR